MSDGQTSYLVRIEVRRRLLERVAARAAARDDMDDVDVLYRLPPNHPGRRVIVGGDVEGEVSPRAMRQDRKPRVDSFDLSIFCIAGQGSVPIDQDDPLDPGGYESADKAVLELVQLVDDELADDPRLGGMPYIVTMAGLEGPNGGPTQAGPESGAVITVHCEAHHR